MTDFDFTFHILFLGKQIKWGVCLLEGNQKARYGAESRNFKDNVTNGSTYYNRVLCRGAYRVRRLGVCEVVAEPEK